MKRSLIYLMVGVISFGAFGGGTYGLLKMNEPPVQETPPVDDDDDDDVLEEVVQTPKDRFMTNLLASNLKVNRLDVGIDTGVENIAVSFTGALDYDGKKLAGGDFSAISASGDLNLKVAGFDETISFSFPGDNSLYFSYMEKDFSISINSITSIIDLIPLFTTEEIAQDTLEEETINEIQRASDLDLGSLLDDLTDMLNNIKEKETENGYEYTLEIPDLATIVLSSDKNDLLTGIKLVNPITIEGISITLDADVQAYKDESFVQGPNGEYQSLDTITNVVGTLTDIMESKTLTAKLDVNVKSIEDDTLDLALKAKLGADINGVVEDFTRGIYELSILPEGTIQGNPQLNSVDIHYENETILLKVNNLLKGKITNSTIEDIIELVNQNTEDSESSEEVNDLLNNLFGGSVLMDLINGDFTSIKSAIYDFNSYEEKLEVTFNESFLNSSKKWGLAINWGENELKGIEIIDFTIDNFEIDLRIDLEKSFNSAAIFDDPSSFKDYKTGVAIYKTIADILNTKQFLANYEISLVHKTDLFTFNGELGADLNNVDFNNLETLLNGTFKLTANAKYGEKRASIAAQCQDETLFLKYNNIIANSIKGQSIMDLIDVISNKFGGVETDSSGKNEINIDEILTLLALNVEEYNALIDQIMTFDFTGLEDYVLIDHLNNDENKITVKILPHKGAASYIYLEIGTDSHKLTHIQIRDVYIGDARLSLKLNLQENTDFRITDTSSYAPLDTLLGNVMNLVDNTRFNVDLNASIVDDDPSVDPITLSAAAQFDIETTEFYGNLDLSAKLPTDSKVYNHHIKFDNYFVGNGDENELLVRYYGNDNSEKPLRAFISDGEFGRMLDVLTNIPEGNSILFLIDVSTDISIEMPLLDIINGDYAQIFNDWIKTFQVGPDQMNLIIDGALFNIDSDIDLLLTYDDDSINSLKIQNLRFGSMTINATINLNQYDEALEEQRLSLREPREYYTYINFNYMDLFLQVGINTTQSRRFHLMGEFNLSLPKTLESLISNIAIYSSVDLKLVINEPDGSVNAVIEILNKKDANSTYGTGDAGYRKTEFFIQSNNDCIVKQTRVVKEGLIFSNKYREVDIFRVTQSEMVSNIHYYLLKYTFNMNDLIFDLINDAVINPSTDSSTGEANNILNFKYENIIAALGYNPGDRSFSTTLDLGSIVRLENVASVLSQGTITISFTHSKDYILHDLTIEGEPLKISILGMNINLGIYLHVTNDIDNSFSMAYFDEFIKQYYEHPTYSKLPYYEYRTGNTAAIVTSRTQI